ncbi:heterokaryon incompatibility protein-domain-containing protein [Apodospora peruviana]|uniref:Heterokaryon incompatibility protein-domain-containing protein n=1 Tax=Apodospora peruviana TaxID=516989 RepID=A0AAE0MEZ8_9PEZI|nr:heterokaryon incompatibility protein-domain-containing protein [Apodospora peruviana]
MPRYAYRRLQGNRIRLIRLLPHLQPDGPLRCDLIECPLPDNPSESKACLYEALSYVWGSSAEDDKQLLYVDEEGQGYQTTLTITANLHEALLQLRDHHLGRILWIDAVCINQEDTEERNYQVAMMARIYAAASRVVVWLGPGQSTTTAGGSMSTRGEPAFTALREASIRVAILNYHSDPEDEMRWRKDDNEAAAILELFKLSWFKRIWVLQEVAAARHIALMRGSSVIDGHVFALGAKAFQGSPRPPSRSIEMALSAADLMKNALFQPPSSRLSTGGANSSGDRFTLNIKSLAQLLDIFHTREASDPRDKVYALLGMCSDDLVGSGLMPDYNIKWPTLAGRLIKFLLGGTVVCLSDDGGRITVLVGKGYILGQVTEVTRVDGPEGGVYALKYGEEGPWGVQTCYAEAPVCPVMEGDLVCILEGADLPMVVRVCWDFVSVVKIRIDPGLRFTDSLTQRDRNLRRNRPLDLLLVWDWCRPARKETSEFEHIGVGPLAEQSDVVALECSAGGLTRLRNITVVLWEAERYTEGEETMNEAVRLYKEKTGEEALEDVVAVGQIFEGSLHHQTIAAFSWLRTFVGKRGYKWDDEVIESAVKMAKDPLLGQFIGSKNEKQSVVVGEYALKRANTDTWEGRILADIIVDWRDIRFGDEALVWMLEPDAAKTIRRLLDSGLLRFDDMAKAVARLSTEDKWNSLELLFHEQGDFHISEDILAAAAANKWWGDQMMTRLLLHQGAKERITGSVLVSAAKNRLTGSRICRILKDALVTDLTITEEVVVTAARFANADLMDLLLGKTLTETPVPVTEAVTVAAVQGGSLELMQALFRSRGESLPITESVAVTAVQWEDVKMFELLFEQRGPKLPVTETVLVEALITKRSPQITDLLRKHVGEDVDSFERRRYDEISSWPNNWASIGMEYPVPWEYASTGRNEGKNLDYSYPSYM